MIRMGPNGHLDAFFLLNLFDYIVVISEFMCIFIG
jgi:hypothetical protein